VRAALRTQGIASVPRHLVRSAEAPHPGPLPGGEGGIPSLPPRSVGEGRGGGRLRVQGPGYRPGRPAPPLDRFATVSQNQYLNASLPSAQLQPIRPAPPPGDRAPCPTSPADRPAPRPSPCWGGSPSSARRDRRRRTVARSGIGRHFPWRCFTMPRAIPRCPRRCGRPPGSPRGPAPGTSPRPPSGRFPTPRSPRRPGSRSCPPPAHAGPIPRRPAFAPSIAPPASTGPRDRSRAEPVPRRPRAARPPGSGTPSPIVTSPRNRSLGPEISAATACARAGGEDSPCRPPLVR